MNLDYLTGRRRTRVRAIAFPRVFRGRFWGLGLCCCCSLKSLNAESAENGRGGRGKRIACRLLLFFQPARLNSFSAGNKAFIEPERKPSRSSVTNLKPSALNILVNFAAMAGS